MQGCFFLRKKPLGRSGFGVQQLENRYDHHSRRGKRTKRAQFPQSPSDSLGDCGNCARFV
jgi:hypothetical protein